MSGHEKSFPGLQSEMECKKLYRQDNEKTKNNSKLVRAPDCRSSTKSLETEVCCWLVTTYTSRRRGRESVRKCCSRDCFF